MKKLLLILGFSLSLCAQNNHPVTANRIVRNTGAPSSGLCTTAADVGKVYIRTDAAAVGASFYSCDNTAAMTYAWEVASVGGGTAGTVISIATTSPIAGGTITTTGTISCPTCTVTIASGSKALDFASTATGACATVITDTATGTASTDTIVFTTNASIKAVTGYVPAATGGFSINAYPTTNTVNFEACNWTSGTVDPGSITVNWKVIR